MLLNSKYGVFGYAIFINYTLVFMGLILFLVSLFLLGKNLISNIGYVSYTGIHLMEWFRHFQFDILNYSGTAILGIVSLLFTILTLVVGLTLSRTDVRRKKTGAIGFMLMFFLYQLFWIIAIAAVVRGSKIKWR
jgi:hypothetical protein